MPQVDFNKFNCLAQDVGRGVHNLNADILKVALTNTPPVVTNAVLGDITQIGTGNGYPAGGGTVTGNTFIQTSGIGKLLASNMTFTATTGTMGPFRYAVLYNSTAAAKNLIGWWDYGSAVTLVDTDMFPITFDATAGILTLS